VTKITEGVNEGGVTSFRVKAPRKEVLDIASIKKEEGNLLAFNSGIRKVTADC
jgi:hypothetical protein